MRFPIPLINNIFQIAISVFKFCKIFIEIMKLFSLLKTKFFNIHVCINVSIELLRDSVLNGVFIAT